MAYSSERFIKCAGGRGVLEMAVDLHGWVTGAADLRDADETAEGLREVIRDWRKPHDSSLLFDSAVYTLIRTALGEYDEKKRNGR